MRGSIFPTGLIVMPVFACADKGDYAVSVGSTITVKFNAKASSSAFLFGCRIFFKSIADDLDSLTVVSFALFQLSCIAQDRVPLSSLTMMFLLS